MLKKSATLLLVSTMLTAGAAMAQTGAPSSTSPGSSSTSSAPAGAKFVTEQSQNEFRGSKLVGLNVYGSDNQKIGDINEILLDKSGNAKAAVIGVGGFLGIGEKNVAVEFSSLEWVNTKPDTNRSASSASGTSDANRTASTAGSSDTNRSTSSASTSADPNRSTASTMGTAGAGSSMGTAGDASSSAGTSASTAAGTAGTRDATATGSTNRSSADTAASQGYPDHAVLRMTKDDLNNAPTFRYFADANSGSRSGASNSGSSGGSAPKQ
jgi:sporulation protein YlmC with PRC-barrel domain